jgi:glycosyltransferase involved in cell wall biosynthesis
MSQFKPKIVIIADFSWSYFLQGAKGRGGGQANPWLIQLAEEFVAYSDEFEFHWIILDRSMQWGVEESKDWGKQYFHRLYRGKIMVDLLLGYQPSRSRLLKKIRTIKPAIVHCWGTERPFSIVFNDMTVPTILSMQGVLTAYKEIDALPPGLCWKIITAFEPGFIRSADVVTAESEWGVNQVKKIAPDAKTYKVEYGVHRGFYDVDYEPNDDQPYALFVGTLDKRKGLDVLIRAMAGLEGCGWSLRVVGDGGLKELVLSCGLSNVEFMGQLDWEALQAELSQARCLVLPTRADTSPNVVKEARVIGLPVITTKHGGQSGYVLNGVNGLIVDPLNSAVLAKCLCCVMEDPAYAKKLGAANHDKDRAYFLPVNMAKGFVNIYKSLIQ